MKFRTTLFLLIAFAALLVFVLVVDFPEEKESREYLVNHPPYDVVKIEFSTGDSTLVMEKHNDEDWMITSPLNAPADKIQVETLAEDMSELTYEKVVETESSDLDKYGIPVQEIRLHYKDKPEPVTIHIGEKNPLDNTYFAKLSQESRVVLLPSRLSTTLEKGLDDFRKKDIFQFETENTGTLAVTTPEISWQAEKKSGEWFLTEPVQSLADHTGIQGILDSLAGLKAETFISEDKTEEDMRKYGLSDPPYHAALNLPAENKKVDFYLNQTDEQLYATTNESTKIITVSDTILTNLDKPVSDLREKSIADFYSWDVTRIDIESPDLSLSAVKDKEGVWHLDSPEGPEAVKQEIEDLLRKISYLEASEFIDPPWNAEEYGLTGDAQKLTITVSADEKEEAETVTLLIGEEDKENNQVTVKNQRFDYLFKTDAEFLQNYPSQRPDWLEEKDDPQEEK
jgi:hypothetical protein